MNLLIIIDNLTLRGGTERSAIAVANELSKIAKYEVHILSCFGTAIDAAFNINSRINVHTLNCLNSKSKYFEIISGIRNYIKINNINVVFSVEMFSCIFTLPAVMHLNKNLKPRLIAWEHFNYTVTLGKRLRKVCRFLASKYADTVVTLTEKDRLMWIDNLHPKAKIVSIKNIAPFPIVQSSYNIDSKTIIAVGRLTYQKGFDRLIEIWNAFIKKYSITNWKLQIIGSGEDHDLILELIKKYNLSDTIELIPNVSNINRYYEKASFLLMTSRFEGLPMVLIEAQSFGLPIISYDCVTGPSDIIVNNTGFLIEENDVDSFAAKIAELINNPKTRISMSRNATLNVAKYSPESISNEWCKVLESFES